MKFKKRLVAVGVIWRDGRFLASKRPEGFPLAGYWEFPGGKIEEGEEALEALGRELREELGILVTEAEFWKTFSHVYAERCLEVTLHFFHVRAFQREPASLEGQELRWLSPEEAASMNFLRADVAVLEELAAGLK